MQRWMITGAGRGIGLEIARQILQRGDAVIATVRSDAAAQALRTQFAGADAARLQVLVFDVRDRGAIAQASSQVTERIDVIVNNAGILGPGRQSALDTDFDGFLDALAVNAMGPLAVTQAFLPRLRRDDRARVVWITSRMGSFASYHKDDLIAYQASKAAANKLVRALATTLAPKGIIVIAAHPGLVRTDLAGARAADSPNSVSAGEAASGLLKVIDGLQAGDNGRFLDHAGREIPW